MGLYSAAPSVMVLGMEFAHRVSGSEEAKMATNSGAYKTLTFRFGPGRMESISVRVYRARRDASHLIAKVEGTFTVYCGHGNTHQVAITEQFDGFTTSTDQYSRWLKLAYAGDESAAYDLADEGVEFGLSNSWDDPCEDGEL